MGADAKRSIRRNVHCVTSSLRGYGHLMSAFLDECKICEVKNHRLQCNCILIIMILISLRHRIIEHLKFEPNVTFTFA